MNNLDYIKEEIGKLYESNSTIHISLKLTRPKIFMDSRSAIITGVYKNIFQIEQIGNRSKRTIQYGDVLTGLVIIDELNYVPTLNISKK